MKPEQENFEPLRRLIKIKRYEVPPPGYFNDFSGQVLIRIKHGGRETQDSVMEWLFMEAPWIRRMLNAFEARPAVAWVFGGAICALVVSGIVLSETVQVTPTYVNKDAEELATKVKTAQNPILPQPIMTSAPLFASSSTNETTASSGSLFDIMPTMTTLPASSSVQPPPFRLGDQ